MILKSVPAGSQQTPKGFPVQQGPAEFWVYTTANPTLSEYLAKCMLATRLKSPSSYVFVLEDLSDTYQKPPKHVGWHPGVANLPVLHEALSDSVATFGHRGLLEYDRDFSEAIESYAEENLGRLHEITDHALAREVASAWQRISDCYLSREFDRPELHRHIHGDYNTGNVFVSRNDRFKTKVVDWEWAGKGLPHTDLASYLRSAPRPVQLSQVAEYAKHHPEITSHEHERLFFRSLLERSIVDLALFSGQVAHDIHRYRRLASAITASLSRITNSVSELGF